MSDLPQKTYDDLQWPKLLAALAARCWTDAGEARARSLELLSDEAAICQRLAEVDEVRALLESGEVFPLDGVHDVVSHVDRARRHGVLSAEELVQIGRTLSAFGEVVRFAADHQVEAPHVARLVPSPRSSDATSLKDLREVVLTCFEDDGQLADRASPELGRLRAHVRSLRERMSRTIDQLLESYGDVLQDNYFTIREERYVLPVRTDAHRRVPGIVHGHSGSGQTIYVEPREITSMGNDLMLARLNVSREEQRVLTQLSEEVRLLTQPITAALGVLTTVDVRVAAARLARDLDGTLPQVSSEGKMVLRDVRHPLLVLDGAEVVANTITLEQGGALVVSGPNGGGKTVALKTAGLAFLMLRAGLPLAAGGDSSLPVARQVFTDMGDDQSLEQSLSTFAAHMTNIAKLLAQVGPGDVVLLDELAGGTDPAEGAALATEIACALSEAGAAVMCTTHYTSLKLLALQLDRFSGASLGFDRKGLAPTFRLASGAPGVSGALAAAQRYGVPQNVIDGARRRMGEDTERVSRLLDELEAERQRLVRQGDSLTEERAAVEQSRRALASERDELRRRSRDRVDKELQGLMDDLRKARQQVQAAETQLRRRRHTAATVSEASAVLSEVGRKLGPGGTLAEAQSVEELPGRQATEEELRPGVSVYLTTMRAKGEVAETPRRGKVRVTVGSAVTNAAIASVRIIEGKTPPASRAPRQRPLVVDAAADGEVPAMTPDNTLDLRGERVDDALREADKFIDRTLQRGWQVAFFIHGHGTGALRQALRLHFEDSPYVLRHKAGQRYQGGEGVTVIWLV